MERQYVNQLPEIPNKLECRYLYTFKTVKKVGQELYVS